MAVTLIAPEDIAPFATVDPVKLAAMVVDVTAKAVSVAPCLADTTDPDVLASAKATLRQAILRWHDFDTDTVTTNQAGPFSQTISPAAKPDSGRRSSLLWPSEIVELQTLCSGAADGAFTVDTAVGVSQLAHAESCDMRFDATRPCSCGALLTGLAPLWGNR